MNVLSKDYQQKWQGNNLLTPKMWELFRKNRIKAHNGINNPISSQACCMNFWYPFITEEQKENLRDFLEVFGIKAQKILTFKPNSTFYDCIYPDSGNVLFEWIGPIRSPIGENDGYMRGHQRTSIDAYILAKINNRVTQILIEWKFTESYSSRHNTGKFLGAKGIERLARYAPIIAKYREWGKEILFNLDEIDYWGLYDICYEPFYQLLRQHLLAQETLGRRFGDYYIEDYIIMHLSHSQNHKLNILTENQAEYSKGLAKHVGREIHEIWHGLLSNGHKNKFIGEYWDLCFQKYKIPPELNCWGDYISERYVGTPEHVKISA
ncbi:MAG TPA: hypothetical protein P5556_02300 [Candidatus Gastranaerophilales bacterium]|nr:hypothetical protein [Candidatus Gastranaerophilales bacterium]